MYFSKNSCATFWAFLAILALSGSLPAQSQLSIWPNNPDTPVETVQANQEVEVGMKFQSKIAGTIIGIRFYKVDGNPDTTHRLTLWSSTVGQHLAYGDTANESNEGWQTVFFSAPVIVVPNTTYIASYHSPAPSGYISLTQYYYPDYNHTGGSCSATLGYNSFPTLCSLPSGVYSSGSGDSGTPEYWFPSQDNGMGHNYWVDVIFQPSSTALENALNPGTDAWRITSNPAVNREIEGYASQTSVNRGENIALFVSTGTNPDPNSDPEPFTYTVYRMGWYQGKGAREMQSRTQASASRQPTPAVYPPNDQQSGLIECNWYSSVTLTNTAGWPSGYYLVKLMTGDLQTPDQNTKASYIIFVVRDDYGNSDLLVQSSVATWQAYNYWPGFRQGKSLYDWGSNDAGVAGIDIGSRHFCADINQADGPSCIPSWANGWGIAARKVSFNRPYSVPARSELAGGLGAGDFFGTSLFPGYPVPSVAGWEYNFVRWLEREGYDVSYCTDVDVSAPDSNVILKSAHKAFLAVGHSEYWSMPQRQHVEEARDAGVNLGFFTGNTSLWQVRYEDSTTNGRLRTLVGYKAHAVCTSIDTNALYDTMCPAYLWKQAPVQGVSREDPLASSRQATTIWSLNPVGMPAATLLGIQPAGEERSVALTGFCVDQPTTNDCSILHPGQPHWALTNTGITTSDDASMPGLVGYEVDTRDNQYSPQNLDVIAQTPFGNFDPPYFYNNGDAYMATYDVANSAATVFASGSMQFIWGLDNFSIDNRTPVRSDKAEQIARNIMTYFLTGIRVPYHQ